MKKSKKRISILLIILLFSVVVLLGVCIFIGIPTLNFAGNAGIEETTESKTEPEIIIEKPKTYLEQCELDYVELPVKREREEAVSKIKELSRYFPALYHVYTNEEQYPIEIFLQWDIRWGYMPYGERGVVGSSGCGPACLSMAVFYLTGNRECTPDAIAQYSLDRGHYIDGVGTAWALLDNYPTEYGLKVTHPYISEETMKADLDKGNVLICSVRPGDFTSEGHFIVIYGYDENGFKVNDPKCVYRSRQDWPYEQIKDDIKRIWSVGK